MTFVQTYLAFFVQKEKKPEIQSRIFKFKGVGVT